MRGVKEAATAAGTVIGACPGCGYNPVRNHPDMEELDIELNWTHTCPVCSRKLCIVCYPADAASCVLEDCAPTAMPDIDTLSGDPR